jgi:hypothetical protein
VFNGNYQFGLWVTSLGSITAKALTANWNGVIGVYLDNQWSLGTGTITVTAATTLDWNNFNNNGQDGLDVYSNRAITLNNIWSEGNIDVGAHVDTSMHYGAYASQNVTFTGRTSFNGNGNGGLQVYADGNITIANLTANSNSGDGAYLDNYLSGVGHGNVTITGTNSASFNGSGGDGLYVDTDGNFTISNITADGNANDGIESYATNNTSISCASLINNSNYDWQIGTGLTLTLKGLVTTTGVTSPYSVGNGNPIFFTTLVISRTCP